MPALSAECHVLALLLAATFASGLDQTPAIQPNRWLLEGDHAISWPIKTDQRLPHEDFLEQGGLRVGQVVRYQLDDKRHLTIDRTVVWPCLRVFPNNTHGSLRHSFQRETEPTITIDGDPLGEVTVEHVVLDGTLSIQAVSPNGITLRRNTFPSPTKRVVLDHWTLRNDNNHPVPVVVSPIAVTANQPGPYGLNKIEAVCEGVPTTLLAPGKELSFAVAMRAWLEGESSDEFDAATEEAARRTMVAGLQQNLRLETPVPEIDRAFDSLPESWSP